MIFDKEGNTYFTHPIFIQYASNKYGHIYDIERNVLINKDKLGYIHIKNSSNKTHKISSDKFVSECFIERNNILFNYCNMYNKNLIHQINANKINLDFSILD